MRGKNWVTLGDTGKMLTSHEEIRQMIQTGRDNQRRRDFRRGGDKKESCWYCRGKGKHESLESCLAWGERCEKCGKENHFAKFWKQKKSIVPIRVSEESSSNESTYIIQEETAKSEAKKNRRVAPILMRKKTVNVSWNVKLTVVHHAM